MEAEAYHEMAALEAKHWWYAGMRSITAGLIEREIGEHHDLRILDAGCGTGANLSALSAYGRAWGLDYSPLALQYASKTHGQSLIRGSVDALPYPAEHFDMVTSFDVLVSYEVRDDVGAIREMARVTRHGGFVLLRLAALPALRGPHDTVVHGIRRYTAQSLRTKLEAAGLSVRRLTYANSLMMPLALVTRSFQNLAVALGAKPQSDVGNSESAAAGILKKLLEAEGRWIASGRDLPPGVSIFALGQKQ